MLTCPPEVTSRDSCRCPGSAGRDTQCVHRAYCVDIDQVVVPHVVSRGVRRERVRLRCCRRRPGGSRLPHATQSAPCRRPRPRWRSRRVRCQRQAVPSWRRCAASPADCLPGGIQRDHLTTPRVQDLARPCGGPPVVDSSAAAPGEHSWRHLQRAVRGALLRDVGGERSGRAEVAMQHWNVRANRMWRRLLLSIVSSAMRSTGPLGSSEGRPRSWCSTEMVLRAKLSALASAWTSLLSLVHDPAQAPRRLAPTARADLARARGAGRWLRPLMPVV